MKNVKPNPIVVARAREESGALHLPLSEAEEDGNENHFLAILLFLLKPTLAIAIAMLLYYY